MKHSLSSTLLNFLIGLICAFIGFVNCFWGNDPFVGYLITLVSVIFYIPLYSLITEKLGPKIILTIKVVLVLFILWSSLGVGAFFSKLEMMKLNFPLPNINL